jgi:hypothetical protein
MQRIKEQEATAVAAGNVDVRSNWQKLRVLSGHWNLENRKWETERLGRADKNGTLRPKLSALSTEIFIGC